MLSVTKNIAGSVNRLLNRLEGTVSRDEHMRLARALAPTIQTLSSVDGVSVERLVNISIESPRDCFDSWSDKVEQRERPAIARWLTNLAQACANGCTRLESSEPFAQIDHAVLGCAVGDSLDAENVAAVVFGVAHGAADEDCKTLMQLKALFALHRYWVSMSAPVRAAIRTFFLARTPVQWVPPQRIQYGCSLALRGALFLTRLGDEDRAIESFTRDLAERIMRRIELKRAGAFSFHVPPQLADPRPLLEQQRLTYGLLEASFTFGDARFLNTALKANDLVHRSLARRFSAATADCSALSNVIFYCASVQAQEALLAELSR